MRMALDRIEGVNAMDFNLDERTVTVIHDTDGAMIESALEALNLKMTPLSEVTTTSNSGPDEATERRVLVIALVINATLFAAEFAAGVVSRSMGLLADSLDMLADASVYALSLVAVGGSTLRKKRLAATSGYLQLGLALFGLVEVARRFFVGGRAPGRSRNDRRIPHRSGRKHRNDADPEESQESRSSLPGKLDIHRQRHKGERSRDHLGDHRRHHRKPRCRPDRWCRHLHHRREWSEKNPEAGPRLADITRGFYAVNRVSLRWRLGVDRVTLPLGPRELM